jgi:dihydroorotate dehydrogenase (fumarate)
MMADISTSIADIPFKTCFSNASGVLCTTIDQLLQLDNDDTIGAIVTKSCTLKSRIGNPSPRYHGHSNLSSSINSMGLPNAGVDYYINAAQKLNKPTFISVAGLSLEENVNIIRRIVDVTLDACGVELNLSCPNVPGKPQIGYDFEATDETLRKVFEISGSHLNVGVKLPPYFDPIHFEHAADVLRRFEKIRWVTCINSIGNGLIIDPITESTLIRPKKGLGGLGGSIVKATALANVYMFRELLPQRVDIIGCGGIVRGVDAFEHILCGAKSLQLGTVIQDHSLSAVHRIISELRQIMSVKGYSNLEAFRGTLKIADEEHDTNFDPSVILF